MACFNWLDLLDLILVYNFDHLISILFDVFFNFDHLTSFLLDNSIHQKRYYLLSIFTLSSLSSFASLFICFCNLCIRLKGVFLAAILDILTRRLLPGRINSIGEEEGVEGLFPFDAFAFFLDIRPSL